MSDHDYLNKSTDRIGGSLVNFDLNTIREVEEKADTTEPEGMTRKKSLTI